MTFITSVERLGFKRAQREIAMKLFQKGMSVEDIASITDLSIKQVKEAISKNK
jgi:transposase